MNYLFEQVVDNVYVLAVWDSSWNSYNNCYLLLNDEGVILIDTGKTEHSDYLKQSLHNLGKTLEDVTIILATHGHEDHIQGATIFKNARKYIHTNDFALVEGLDFNDLLSDPKVKQDFDFTLVGYHTQGSVVFYHRPSKVLFTGDFLCFFGDPLSKDGLVSEGQDLRNEWIEYLRNGGVPQESLDSFLEGLMAINQFEPVVLCTGHGGVLVGDVNQFLSKLLKIGEQNKTLEKQGG